MAESDDEKPSAPPAYNDAVANYLCAVDGDGDYPSLPAEIYVDLIPTASSNSRSLLPPSYESLVHKLQSIEEETTSPDATEADRLSPTPQVVVRSDIPNRIEARPVGKVALCQSWIRYCCDTKVFKVVCGVTAVIICLTLSIVGFTFTHGCPEDAILPVAVQASGVAGVVFMVLAFCTGIYRTDNDQPVYRPILVIVLPAVFIALFIFGCSKMYIIWMKRPCNVLVKDDCSHYCDAVFMVFSVVLYSTIFILLTPFWLAIIYVLLKRLAYNIGRCLCGDKNCIKSDGRWLPCSQ